MKKIVSLLAVTATLAASSLFKVHAAEVLAQYSFDGSLLTSSDTSLDSTASAISNGAGFTSANVNSSLGNPLPALSIDTAQTDGSTQTAAVTANDYFSFTITPDVGTLSLGSLTFDYANYTTSGAFPTETFFVRSSVDAFAANVASSVSSSAASAGVFATANINLTGATFQNVASAIEFRIYISDGTTSALKGAVLDNITLTSVPEPSTLAGLALGGAFLLARRRRVMKG